MPRALGWETSYSLDTLAIYPLVLFLLILQTAPHFLVTSDRCIHHWLPPPAYPLCIPGLYLLTIRTLNRSVERLMRQFSGLTRCVKVTPPDPPGAPRPPLVHWARSACHPQYYREPGLFISGQSSVRPAHCNYTASNLDEIKWGMGALDPNIDILQFEC